MFAPCRFVAQGCSHVAKFFGGQVLATGAGNRALGLPPSTIAFEVVRSIVGVALALVLVFQLLVFSWDLCLG
jgi:hypothetical protein